MGIGGNRDAYLLVKELSYRLRLTIFFDKIVQISAHSDSGALCRGYIYCDNYMIEGLIHLHSKLI